MARKQIAEAAQAAESHFHADLSDRTVARGEKKFCAVHARASAELVRRKPEDRLKPPDEMVARDANGPCNLRNRRHLIFDFDQHLASLAELPE